MKFFQSKNCVIIFSVVILFLGIVCFFYQKGNPSTKVEFIDDGPVVENEEADIGGSLEEEESSGEIGIGVGSEQESALSSGEEICVHIIGEVNCPGVVKMRRGLRVIDAIRLAGGETEEADLNKINLAYVLADGQQVCIPRIGECVSGSDSLIIGGTGQAVRW